MHVPNFSDAGRSSTPLSIGVPLHLFKPLIQRPVTVSGFYCQLMAKLRCITQSVKVEFPQNATVCYGGDEGRNGRGGYRPTVETPRDHAICEVPRYQPGMGSTPRPVAGWTAIPCPCPQPSRPPRHRHQGAANRHLCRLVLLAWVP